MENLYNLKFRFVMLFGFLFLASGSFFDANSQSFSQNGINFNGKGSLQNGTSLTFGPDGRLYVTEYTGSIKIFTIERTGPGNYSVISMEELKGIQSIQDHNDDGTPHSSQFRETIGMAVTGTAANPVIYVSSSDFRIGGGGGGGSGDVGLDTNSGIITRYSRNGSSWDEVDIVRGLPRSEENHATNGIEFATINGIDYLIVAQGGHTNAGGPSANFAYTTEYALSAAVLSINLTMIEAMPVQEANGRKYIYNLPTLDDPTRPNKNGIIDPDAPGYDGIDIYDPFGGNDGLNQAIIVPGGPVQIFSPGYRNAYDLVITQSGAVYVTDNGANGGWGGFPVNEGGADATNAYDPNEPGSTSSSGGEQINNKDHLSLVTLDLQNYTFGSFYGGHPTPVRANPYGAGLYTNPAITGTQGAVFRTQPYDPNGSRPGSTTNPSIGLPANWPPVKIANPVEGDYRGPGDPNPDGPVDAIVTTWGTNTNGIDEYTASNFNGAMKGDLIAGVNTGVLRRVELNPNGSLKKLTPSFASGIGGDALGITCNGDNDIFPGTIWVATLNGKLVVLEPQDFGACLQPGDIGYDSLADYDHDGYTNQDEIDNGTDPCNGGSQPSDHDKAAGAPLISDLNDPDDDNDGILDANDPFQMGDFLKSGSDAFELPVINELFSSNPSLKGYMGLGMTGLMNNGDPNPNWLNWLDRRDDPKEPNPNDILGGAIGAMTMQMTAGTALGTTNTQEKGFQYGVKVSEATGKFTVVGGIMNFNAPLQLYGHPNSPNGELGFFIGDGTQSNYIKFVITKTGLLAIQEINDVPSPPLKLDIPVANRPNAGAIFFFNVDPSNGKISLEYSFDNGPTGILGTFTAQGGIIQAIQQPNKDLAVGLIGTSNAIGIELEGTWDYLNVTGGGPISDTPVVLYRVNAGGPTILAIDDKMNWGADTTTGKSLFLANAGANNTAGFNMTSYTSSVNQNTTPIGIFNTERFDGVGGPPNMTYSFPVPSQGSYVVRLYMGNGYTGTSSQGQRVFDVEIEGYVHPQMNDIDLSALFGHGVGGMLHQTVEVTDGTLDISFIHGVENPLINGIEILGGSGEGSSTTIEVAQIEDQMNVTGEQLDGSLVVQATGGDGNLSYSMSGAPSGVVINSATGVISGTIAKEANLKSPYSVTINVDDSDAETTDAVKSNFTWTVKTGEPTIIKTLPDITRSIGAANDNINLHQYFSDNGGSQNLTYSVTKNINPVILASISVNNLQIKYPSQPSFTNITIRATDSDSNFVEQTFIVTVVGETTSLVLYRVNAGGPLISSIDDDIDWSADTSAKNSVYLTVPAQNRTFAGTISSYSGGVDQTSTPINIFKTERYDGSKGAPNMTYSFPVTAAGNYVVRLYMGNGYSGTASPGKRIFDVQIEGVLYPELDDIDLSARFGHQVGAVITKTIEVTDGNLDIVFLHGSIENPLINAIEILGEGTASNPIMVANIPNQTNTSGDILNGSLVVSATGGDGNLNYSISGQPLGVFIEPTNGQIGGTIDSGADANSPYSVTVTVDDQDGQTSDAVTTTFNWTVTAGAPVVTAALPDLERIVSSADDIIDLHLHFKDNDGVENLIYTVAQNTDMTIGAEIAGNLLTLSYPANPAMADITIRATDVDNNIAEQTFRVNVIYDPEGTLIEVAPIAGQNNITGDVLDGNLAVTATGGDGALNYAMTGAPAGVSIDPITGVISGTIPMDAEFLSPYNVLVTVDDTDDQTVDAVITNFTWTVTSGTPVVTAVLPDLERIVSSADENINLNLYFSDNDGVENLVYTVELNSDPSIGVVIVENILTLSYPVTLAASEIRIRATDATGLFAEQEFKVTVQEAFNSMVLYRVNAGGPAIASVDDNIDWSADTSLKKSVYLAEPGKNNTFSGSISSYSVEVDQSSTPIIVFKTERYDSSKGAPNMTYSFPVTATGNYEVRLYMGNGYKGTSSPGKRIFDVKIEGVLYPELDDIDLSARFGHQVGAVIKKTVEVTDGTLDIVFLHGPIENPLINAIEILSSAEDHTLKIASENYDKEAKIETDQVSDASVIAVKIYPNPGNAEVYLQAPNPSVEITAVSLYDYNGRYLRTFTTGHDLTYEGDGRYMFNILGMPNAVYILKISTASSGVFTLRLIKED